MAFRWKAQIYTYKFKTAYKSDPSLAICKIPSLLCNLQSEIMQISYSSVIWSKGRKLFNSSVVLESSIPLFLMICTGWLDKSSTLSQSLGSTFKQLRHTYAVCWHTYSFFSKNSLIYANVPLGIHGRDLWWSLTTYFLLIFPSSTSSWWHSTNL